MQVLLFVEQIPDWQALALPAQGPAPLTSPQRPFVPHTLTTHSFACVQLAPFAAAHVFVVALHVALRQTAAAFPLVQVPLWRPSLGIATPFALSGVHVPALRLQCSLDGHWLSAEQTKGSFVREKTAEVPALGVLAVTL